MSGQAPSTDQKTTGRVPKPESLANLRKGGGRPKGVPNKNTTLLKDALLEAANKAGGVDGLVGYLQTQATANPQSFLPLLGKVLPLQVTGADGDKIKIEITRRIVGGDK